MPLSVSWDDASHDEKKVVTPLSDWLTTAFESNANEWRCSMKNSLSIILRLLVGFTGGTKVFMSRWVAWNRPSMLWRFLVVCSFYCNAKGGFVTNKTKGNVTEVANLFPVSSVLALAFHCGAFPRRLFLWTPQIYSPGSHLLLFCFPERIWEHLEMGKCDVGFHYYYYPSSMLRYSALAFSEFLGSCLKGGWRKREWSSGNSLL